ncbi:tRNA (N(6)-L-threonylcarbamoyladenosine(37)-C(2))-methylthiotransferase MtaB [Sphingobium jiangsuense]|uniref:Threonylcarbamoyladenosine tRNA methylthiotransferase MtaB n=1 Tax=Sphingobium jiangsuense TaxID=870476 RepID=A0A7W6BDX8_9SPHN|nr:tRNA (N(6)-L-threonylcarbamoyladenosine(37)-C(2))-methylthiotransferase MtaB [Sphingobium jiangsuense]MBB3924334.1 threonylcarbamoyladenosine tRNA methylthiotransferase MtaB [Sphingobium jiangsuense]GLT01757.1 tRNA (N(6)-L-threonylcarbamoyladenosine(37)-C(2))-methylthiotransferase MtaB [Sphingobium jiangsuense]
MTDPTLITFGCRLNIAESEAMRGLAQGQDDLVIVNSCAVTGEAVRQARQAIRRAKRERPDARIVVTGCAAQTDPAMFAAMPEVDSVLGNREKLKAESFAPEPQKVRVSDIMGVRDTAPHLITAFAERARAFVEVQNGCDHRCTFCIIPYGRGNSRSVPAGAVIDRVKALVDEGYKEIVLTGVDVTSYGADLPGAPTLGSLVERLLTHVPDLPRLRLSSLDSVEIDDRLFALVTQEKRVMPHLHLSLQAGDDMILKRMKRRHSRADAVRMVERLKAIRPEISIGADIIAGFPTETEAMFANSLSLVADCTIVHGHIFPYSPRAGTPAAKMPQVDKAVIKDRAARLRAACAANRARWLASLVGTEQQVVAEGDGSCGHAENFAPVRLPRVLERGEIARVAISGVEKDRLIAQEARYE